jgi:hypothetical protein
VRTREQFGDVFSGNSHFHGAHFDVEVILPDFLLNYAGAAERF